MENHDLEKMAQILRESGSYQIIAKYHKPLAYNVLEEGVIGTKIGVFLDVETTGLSFANDKIIELGMVKFEYTDDGRIFRLLDEYCGYQDPGIPISEFITKLTGITEDMVKRHHIQEADVNKYLKEVDIIIAHNAQFDRTFFEMSFPNILPKSWACSMYDINWKEEDINSFKLEYIAYKYNFFFKGHRAIIDCLAGVHILAQELINTKQPVMQQLLTNALAIRFKLYAISSPYDSKDLLRARGYRWSNGQDGKYKAWYIELTENKVEAEIEFLRSYVYNGLSITFPVEILDSHSRFSVHYNAQSNNEKYRDKLEWFNKLCTGRPQLI